MIDDELFTRKNFLLSENRKSQLQRRRNNDLLHTFVIIILNFFSQFLLFMKHYEFQAAV